jgi:hypothetical protein
MPSRSDGAGRRSRLPWLCLSLLCAVLAQGCSSSPKPGTPSIALVPGSGSANPARIEVRGLADEDLAALRGRPPADPEWSSLIKVSVAGAPSTEVPDMLGRYAIADRAITFTPLFSFDAGRTYRVAFDASRLPHARSTAPIVADVMLPAPVGEPTRVVAFHPSAQEVPENLLRIYVEFSAPMSRTGGLEFVKLVELSGDGKTERIEEGAFLPLEADFWSPDHTRYTLFFDPGRVKDDILPNRESGRPLRAGRRYAIDIASSWRDANGRPLEESYRHTFRAGPALDEPIRLADWRFELPAAGTRNPLRITFLHPLDHGILARALSVETGRQQPIDGTALLEAHDSAWSFTPAAAWEEGDYNLVAQSYLEDPQGNQINRAFEETAENDGAKVIAPEAYRRAFAIGGGRITRN